MSKKATSEGGKDQLSCSQCGAPIPHGGDCVKNANPRVGDTDLRCRSAECDPGDAFRVLGTWNGYRFVRIPADPPSSTR